MDAKEVIELFAEHIDTGRSYSGRGMYGSVCFAIVGSQHECHQAMAGVIKAMTEKVIDFTENMNDEIETGETLDRARNDLEKWIDTLFKFEMDSMGRSDVVIYWRDIPFKEVDHEQDVEAMSFEKVKKAVEEILEDAGHEDPAAMVLAWSEKEFRNYLTDVRQAQ